MPLFHVIDDATVILRDKRGVFRQAKVYSRGDDVYAGYGSGFVRLLGAGHTTCPNISYDDLDGQGWTEFQRVGGPKMRAARLMKAA